MTYHQLAYDDYLQTFAITLFPEHSSGCRLTAIHWQWPFGAGKVSGDITYGWGDFYTGTRGFWSLDVIWKTARICHSPAASHVLHEHCVRCVGHSVESPGQNPTGAFC